MFINWKIQHNKDVSSQTDLQEFNTTNSLARK